MLNVVISVNKVNFSRSETSLSGIRLPLSLPLPLSLSLAVFFSSWAFIVGCFFMCSMEMKEYGNIMAFEVNMYYKINRDEDLRIPSN